MKFHRNSFQKPNLSVGLTQGQGEGKGLLAGGSTAGWQEQLLLMARDKADNLNSCQWKNKALVRLTLGMEEDFDSFLNCLRDSFIHRKRQVCMGQRVRKQGYPCRLQAERPAARTALTDLAAAHRKGRLNGKTKNKEV